MITITLSVPVVHGGSPYHSVLEAIGELQRAVENSTSKNPAFGGDLKDVRGVTIGSYSVEFGEHSNKKFVNSIMETLEKARR